MEARKPEKGLAFVYIYCRCAHLSIHGDESSVSIKKRQLNILLISGLYRIIYLFVVVVVVVVFVVLNCTFIHLSCNLLGYTFSDIVID